MENCGPAISDEFSEATLLEIEKIMKLVCEPGMSDGLSDAALLALDEQPGNRRPFINDGLSDDLLLRMDIPRATGSPSLLLQENGQRDNTVAAAAGDFRSWEEKPTSTLMQQPALVASQGSNETVECGNAGSLMCNLDPDVYLGTPSSHSSEPTSSPLKRSSGSFDVGSSGSRNVKAKHGEEKILPDYFKQVKPFPDPLSCGPPAPVVRRILGGAQFGDPRKLDFGDEPRPLDPQSPNLAPKRELPQENVHPKECVFRYKDCANHGESCGELSDPLVAQLYGELSFTKRFLILDHCKEGQNYPSPKELEVFKRLEVEEVDNRLFHASSHPDHIVQRDWKKLGNGHLVFTCNVSHSGKCEFTGPRFENGGTPLQHAFGENNVLVVKFEDTKKDSHIILDRYRCLARHGIRCGLKRFFFFAFKDAESKKKQGVSKKNTYGCKAFFVALESSASADTQHEMKRFETIAKARNFVMHPTVPTLSKAISRLQLVLSQTTQIPLDFSKVHIKRIKDIPCLDKDGNEVHDANGKLLIHTDGGGFISKNLAKLCQDEVVKGIKQTDKSDLREKQEYPLMMQVRLFLEGNLWKGVLVVDLKLPDNTIVVRPSMLKVERDESLSTDTFNSLELCNTSRKPMDAKLFQHLILLLRVGGVKEETLLNYVETSMEKLRGYFTGSKEALTVAARNIDFHHSGQLACEMLLSGLEPSQEPFLQKVISEMIKYELKNYSLGKVPVRDTAYLMGCADPTGRLERNQVVIIMGNGTRICREKVLVYKPPGLHPGDVHVFEATWIKEIEAHIGTGTYGIIFSTKGARSVTDEMAGSDLDGDQYWVSWNPELVDSFKPSPPWEAPNLIEEKQPLPRPTTEDEFETLHFEKFIQTKFDPSIIKGWAANTWLVLMDHTMSANVEIQAQRYAKEHLLTLVNLFYESLDAEKSGKEIRWPNQIHNDLYPHFLEKNKDETSQDSSKPRSNWLASSSRKPAKTYDEYTSTSILGRIYDLVKKEDLDKAVNVDVNKVFEYDGYRDYYGYWSKHVNEYGKRTRTMLNAVKLGSFIDQEFRNCACDNVLAEYKKKFLGEGKSNEQLLKEASAIYTAVYGKAVIKESLALQFAWKIAGPQLCEIFANKRGGYICMARENIGFLLRR
ncbi:hypothetical protein KC19_9G119100 [Ceratodon purpureus]|uniref:RNA-dependent RNA polymerase n=1 Tax=Ceratodon purpureus TaxID=3225 RepID=A0A8T0GR47_CERPU|nr:hypothetical protein KC19_9G119100 [Ceratodon purpureus]